MTASVGGHFKITEGNAVRSAPSPDVGREHEDLRPEAVRGLGNELRARDRRRVDLHLVRA